MVPRSKNVIPLSDMPISIWTVSAKCGVCERVSCVSCLSKDEGIKQQMKASKAIIKGGIDIGART